MMGWKIHIKCLETCSIALLQRGWRKRLNCCRERLNKSGYSSVIGKRVVLTGGGAQMNGLQDLARRTLGRNIRIGQAAGDQGFADVSEKSCICATTVGTDDLSANGP